MFLISAASPGVARANDPYEWEVGTDAHTATRLDDVTVLLAGGQDGFDWPVDDVELYDPETDSISAAGDLAVARSCHASALLDEGKVWSIGAIAAAQTLHSLEGFDPS